MVRATAEAAYESGKAHLDRQELEQALIDLDQAKTHDPDNRVDIQQALDETVRRFQTEPQPTATIAPNSRPTVPPGSTVGLPTRQPTPVATPRPAQATQSTRPAQATSTATLGQPVLATWRDPRARFSIGAPRDWQAIEHPQVLAGSGVVEFHDASRHAEFDVAIDEAVQAVSPELYAAGLEIAMQQVPGYAVEQIQPGTTAGSPSIKRVFTLNQRDSSGNEVAARGFQVVVVRGSTPFILSGSAPADQYAHFAALFDQIVGSFMFA